MESSEKNDHIEEILDFLDGESSRKLLNPAEVQMLHLAQHGDTQLFIDHFKENNHCDINSRDHIGRTCIQIATVTQNEGLLDFLLLVPDIRLGDAILHAVRAANMNILDKLLDFSERNPSSDTAEYSFESVTFPPHMTPLILACLDNNDVIIRHLMRRGHDVRFLPEKEYQTRLKKGADLDWTLSLLDQLKAISNPTYMFIKHKDPILGAFILGHMADKYGKIDVVYREAYDSISKQTRQFPVDLLEECRTTEEVEILLKQDHSTSGRGATRVKVYEETILPRMSLAIAYEQKEFVTHRNCQQVLQAIWTEGMPLLKYLNLFWQTIYLIPSILAMPFVFTLYFFLPFLDMFGPIHKIYKYYNSPLNLLIGETVSYLIFLGLLIASVYDTDNFGKRIPDLNNGIDVIIMVYVISMMWDDFKTLYLYGIKPYTRDWWRIYGVAMKLLFFASFITRLVGYIIVMKESSGYKDELRIIWPWHEPILVAEGLYAVAVVMAYAQVLQLLRVSRYTGPIQISLGYMMADITQVFVVFIIIILAFSTGFVRMYPFYEDMVRINADGTTKTQPSAFDSWQSSFKTLFWGIFGFGAITNPEIVVSNVCEPPNNSQPCFPVNKHNLTENVGFFLYGVYYIVVVLMLLNMLIALLSNTFTKVQENADQEWMFHRAAVWMTFFSQRELLPKPLDVLPGPWMIYPMVKWLVKRKRGDNTAQYNKYNCCFFTTKDEAESKKKLKKRYKKLLCTLMSRRMSRKDVLSRQLDNTVNDASSVASDSPIKAYSSVGTQTMESFFSSDGSSGPQDHFQKDQKQQNRTSQRAAHVPVSEEMSKPQVNHAYEPCSADRSDDGTAPGNPASNVELENVDKTSDDSDSDEVAETHI